MTEQADNLPELFNRLRDKVLEKTPVLREVIKKTYHQNLFDHALEYKESKSSPLVLERRHQLIDTIAQRVKDILGPDIAKSVSKQLEQYYFVSTADHHGPICHPFWLDANLVTALPYTETADRVLENIIVLSCANVSLNNSSFPRGLIFHSNNVEKLHTIPFFPAQDRAATMYGFRSYTRADLIRVKNDLLTKVKNGEVDQLVLDKIVAIFDSIYNNDSALGAKNFSEQVTQTNVDLWKQFFPQLRNFPRLVYIDQESIAADLLTNYHLNKNTVIEKIFTDETCRQLVNKYFDGVPGAFSIHEKIGTYLFWALPKGEKYRQQLWLQSNQLVSGDGQFVVPLNSQAIIEKLKSGELVPSMLLTFILLSFYYGLTCLGGFYQPTYLTSIKEAYSKLLAELGDNETMAICASVETKMMGDMAMAFLQDKMGAWHHATGLDLILYGDYNTWGKLVDFTKAVTVPDALDPLMPLFYEVMYPQNQREELLKNVTTDQIVKLTGLDKKIQPCVKM